MVAPGESHSPESSNTPFDVDRIRRKAVERGLVTADKAAVCLIDNRDGLPYESAAWEIGRAHV